MFEELKSKGESLKKDATFIKSNFDISFWEGYLKGLKEAEEYIKNDNKPLWYIKK